MTIFYLQSELNFFVVSGMIFGSTDDVIVNVSDALSPIFVLPSKSTLVNVEVP